MYLPLKVHILSVNRRLDANSVRLSTGIQTGEVLLASSFSPETRVFGMGYGTMEELDLPP